MDSMTVCLCVALALAAGPTPEDWVAKLGAPRLADRDAATSALAKLGPQAIPALQAARQTNNLEARARIVSLLDALATVQVTAPTRVRLDFETEQSLDQIARTLSERTGIKVQLEPENNPGWRLTKIKLVEPEPLLFWDAINRFCKAGGLRISPGETWRFRQMADGSRVQPTVVLISGNAQEPPTSVDGAFLVTLTGLHRLRDLTFPVVPGPGPDAAETVQPKLTDQLYAQIMVSAEPRLSIAQVGPATQVRGVDDQGETLSMPVSEPQNQTNLRHNMRTIGGNETSTASTQITLAPPTSLRSTLKQLKGVLPVVIAARRTEPLSASLVDGIGKVARNEDSQLQVHSMQVDPATKRATIEFSIWPVDSLAQSLERPFMPGQQIPTNPQGIDFNRVELIDADGKPCVRTSFNVRGNGLVSRCTWVADPSPGVGPPTQVRYQTIARTTIEVTFEFDDIPSP